MLAESPGAKLEADAYAPLAALFASVLGRYPTIASEGILLPPPNTGDIDDAAVHRLSATAIFLARDLPLLPLSLEVRVLHQYANVRVFKCSSPPRSFCSFCSLQTASHRAIRTTTPSLRQFPLCLRVRLQRVTPLRLQLLHAQRRREIRSNSRVTAPRPPFSKRLVATRRHLRHCSSSLASSRRCTRRLYAVFSWGAPVTRLEAPLPPTALCLAAAPLQVSTLAGPRYRLLQ